MHRQHPFICIWDDHEIANNAWVGGAENHDPATQGPWPVRVANALQAHYEWLPVRIVDPTQPRRNNRFYAFGDLADIVMPEERLVGRAEQITATTCATPFGAGFTQADAGISDPARQLLGSDEEQWLTNRLRTTPSRWKLLGQGVMFAQLKGVGAANSAGGGCFLSSDQWGGYQPARDRIYSVLKGDNANAPVNNVAVLTGDIHGSWAADLTQEPNNNTATGGYNPATGEGSRAAEFVGTSISSPGVDTDTTGAIAGFLRSVNPHFKYVELTKRGYMLMDVTPERIVGEWWHVATVTAPSTVETFARAFQTSFNTNRLSAAVQTTPVANPPALAP